MSFTCRKRQFRSGPNKSRGNEPVFSELCNHIGCGRYGRCAKEASRADKVTRLQAFTSTTQPVCQPYARRQRIAEDIGPDSLRDLDVIDIEPRGQGCAIDLVPGLDRRAQHEPCVRAVVGNNAKPSRSARIDKAGSDDFNGRAAVNSRSEYGALRAGKAYAKRKTSSASHFRFANRGSRTIVPLGTTVADGTRPAMGSETPLAS